MTRLAIRDASRVVMASKILKKGDWLGLLSSYIS